MFRGYVGRCARPPTARAILDRMGQNGRMSSPELVPRSALPTLIVAWAFGAVAALAVGFFAPIEQRFEWFGVAAGLSIFVAFVVNLRLGRADGFIVRTAGAALGALAVMGVIAFAFFLAGLSALVS